MTKVSIIMPVYNGKEYLRESIESIINQTYKNWEFIIVNEFGSDDGSKEIIEEYIKNDDRIKLIQNSKKEKIAESLNIAIRNSSGEYIARMDADDISMPNRIEEQVNYLETHADIGMVGIQPTYFGDSNFDWQIETDALQIKNNILFYSPCIHPTIMFKKNIIIKNNIFYNKKYTASEDYDFFARFVEFANISNISNIDLYHYRLHESNATYTNNDIGIINYSEIMKNTFKKYLKLDLTDSEIDLLNVHIGAKEYFNNDFFKKYIEFDLLLKKVFVAAKNNSFFDMDLVFKTLRKRFIDFKYSATDNQIGNYKELFNFYSQQSIFNRNYFINSNNRTYNNPKITVLMPVYNGQDYLLDSISSILNQTFDDFELLIILENTSTDNSLEYIRFFDDKRINVYITPNKFGLAKSLNYGIEHAKGKYIARMDSDDLSLNDRLRKQYDFMENSSHIDVCGSWQQHFGPDYMWLHKSPYEDKKIKALLLFECCLCHSTLILRKSTLLKNNYRYNENIRQEDYDLWCRMTEKCNFAILQEILGLYRLHSNNITGGDLSNVSNSQSIIIERNLKKLHIDASQYDKRLLIGFENIYNEHPELKPKAFELINLIIKNNKKYNIYDEEALNYAMNKRKLWINGYENDIVLPSKENIIKKSIKKLFYPLYRRLKFRIINIANEEIDKYMNNNNLLKDRDELLKLMDKTSIIENNINDFSHNMNSSLSEIEKNFINFSYNMNSSLNEIEKKLINFDEKNIIAENKLMTLKENMDSIAIRLQYLESLINNKGNDLMELDFFKETYLNNLNKEKKIFLLGTSEHNNIGDAAIVVGEYEFIRKYFSEYFLIEMSTYEYSNRISYIDKLINDDDIIFIHGGGNIGNKYKSEEDFKRSIISRYPNNKIVVFPQTIYYENNTDGKKELNISKKIFSSKKEMIMFTRGKISLDFANKNFTNIEKYLCVDMALNITKNYCYEREGILCCIRDLNDESGLEENNYNRIFDIVKQYDSNAINNNNLYNIDIIKNNRNFVVNNQLEEFAKHKLIVTDRLHGLIFSLMTNTPCIVISSYNYKLNEFYELIKDNKYVKFIDKDIELLDKSIVKMMDLDISNYKNDYSSYFSEMSQIIKNLEKK